MLPRNSTGLKTSISKKQDLSRKNPKKNEKILIYGKIRLQFMPGQRIIGEKVSCIDEF